MSIDNKMIMDLAEQLGFENSSVNEARRAANMAEAYKNKDEDELLDEILNFKKAMKSDRAQFEKQLKAIKALRVMMNDEQKARLDKIIRLMEYED